jgi:lipopolysaccharide transport system permease protein
MTTSNDHQHVPDARVMHIVDGKAVDPRDYNWLERVLRFLAQPFAESWHHRDLIAAILRRELRERFSGSMAGWVWAVTAPLISLVTYTIVFAGAVKLPNQTASSSGIDYALFVFGGLVAFNFFTEMAYRAPSLLHEYAHYIKQTMFPAEIPDRHHLAAVGHGCVHQGHGLPHDDDCAGSDVRHAGVLLP